MWLVNIGLGTGLVPLGSRPLTEAVFTHIYVALVVFAGVTIWRHND